MFKIYSFLFITLFTLTKQCFSVSVSNDDERVNSPRAYKMLLREFCDVAIKPERMRLADWRPNLDRLTTNNFEKLLIVGEYGTEKEQIERYVLAHMLAYPLEHRGQSLAYGEARNFSYLSSVFIARIMLADDRAALRDSYRNVSGILNGLVAGIETQLKDMPEDERLSEDEWHVIGTYAARRLFASTREFFGLHTNEIKLAEKFAQLERINLPYGTRNATYGLLIFDVLKGHKPYIAVSHGEGGPDVRPINHHTHGLLYQCYRADMTLALIASQGTEYIFTDIEREPYLIQLADPDGVFGAVRHQFQPLEMNRFSKNFEEYLEPLKGSFYPLRECLPHEKEKGELVYDGHGSIFDLINSPNSEKHNRAPQHAAAAAAAGPEIAHLADNEDLPRTVSRDENDIIRAMERVLIGIRNLPFDDQTTFTEIQSLVEQSQSYDFLEDGHLRDLYRLQRQLSRGAQAEEELKRRNLNLLNAGYQFRDLPPHLQDADAQAERETRLAQQRADRDAQAERDADRLAQFRAARDARLAQQRGQAAAAAEVQQPLYIRENWTGQLINSCNAGFRNNVNMEALRESIDRYFQGGTEQALTATMNELTAGKNAAVKRQANELLGHIRAKRR